VYASVRLTNRPIATRKAFQIRMILQHLRHVYLGAVLKSLNAVDYELPCDSNLIFFDFASDLQEAIACLSKT